MVDRINLHRSLLERGQTLADAGFDREAMTLLEHLSENETVDPATVESAEAELASLCFRQGDYRQARRHIQLALVRNPLDPLHHRTLAQILDADEDANEKRTEARFRLAAELGENDPKFLAEYGAFLCEHGKPTRGLKLLRRAVEANAEDLEILEAAIAALVDNGHATEARRLLTMARFRIGESAELEAMADQLEFQVIVSKQHAKEASRQARESVVLPFPQAETVGMGEESVSDEEWAVIRVDPPTRAPVKPRRNRRQS